MAYNTVIGPPPVGPAPVTQVEGSTFIMGNTSFSGADIKVVIHTYGNAENQQNKIKEVIDNWQDASIEQSANGGEIAQLEKSLETVHANTPEFNNIAKKLALLRQRQDILGETIQAYSAESTQLYKDIPKASTKVLAECQTLSLSIHREKTAVRACGTVYPKGFCRGSREIAGSMIFTVFNEHVLYEFLEAHASDFDSNSYTSAVLDQIPPVDVLISFANEYGQVSRMTIYGVEFVDEGQTMSIEDLMTENVVSYVARDFDPMRSVSERKLDKNSIILAQTQPKRASDLLLENDYRTLKEKLNPFDRFSRRRNPFL